ncbi:queuosine precursor transporter [Inquilinus sp. CAU 1745]|uniref:queuosine precursor transporter n=1 Tax=Inquilinus sp. CAU 1745 TaxID=3140369 RepID=UPI00325B6086
MLSLSPQGVVAALQALPPELVLVLELLLCFGAILALLRWFGESGMYAYICVAVIGANVQVLKPVQFGIYDNPVALGTILFSSTFLATDILAEHYGAASARRGVMLGFSTFLFWTVIMILTMGYSPLTPEQAGEAMAWAVPIQGAFETLFVPVPAFFVAGMTAYLISQLHDVWAFETIRKWTQGKALWLRNNVSTIISSLIDNTVFSVLAWVVLAPQPVGWEPLIFTYILGTFLLRVAIALLDTPFMYLSRIVIRRDPPGAASYA